MKAKIFCVLILIMIFLFGCKPAEEPQVSEQPEVEIPSPGPNVSVEEDVIVPAHEPEPEEEETEPPRDPRAILTEHKDSDHFLRAHPGIGETGLSPRKIEIIFNYPLTGTEITLWDVDEKTQYDTKEPIIADSDSDSLVMILYIDDLEPGIYKVKYTAVFAGKEGDGEGYYYFEVE